MTSKQELWPKKPIFFGLKRQNQPSFQKVALPVVTLFWGWLKL
jgi:hypothetical protein